MLLGLNFLYAKPRVVPLEDENSKISKSHFGSLRGTIKIKDDIVNFSSESDWEVNND